MKTIQTSNETAVSLATAGETFILSTYAYDPVTEERQVTRAHATREQLAELRDAIDAELRNSGEDPATASRYLPGIVPAEMLSQYSEPARRDMCRRAAYDMGIQDRRAHPQMLATIAEYVADMIRAEQEPGE